MTADNHVGPELVKHRENGLDLSLLYKGGIPCVPYNVYTNDGIKKLGTNAYCYDNIDKNSSYRFNVNRAPTECTYVNNSGETNMKVTEKTTELMDFNRKFLAETTHCFSDYHFEAGHGVDCFQYIGSITNTVNHMKALNISMFPQDQNGRTSIHCTERFIRGIQQQQDMRKIDFSMSFTSVTPRKRMDIVRDTNYYINSLGESIRSLPKLTSMKVYIKYYSNESCAYDEFLNTRKGIDENGYDVQDFINSLGTCTDLRVLSLINLTLDGAALDRLGDILLNDMLLLRDLTLVNCVSKNIDSETMTRFAQKLSRLSMLTQIRLCSNKFDHASSSALAPIFENNRSLSSLTMKDCNIGITFRNENGQCVQDSTFIDSLCYFLSKNPQQFEDLNMDENPIWSEGLTKIAKSLSSNKSLRRISISNSLNTVSHKDVSTLNVCHRSRFVDQPNIRKANSVDDELIKDGYRGCLQGVIDMVTSINNNVDTRLKALLLDSKEIIQFPRLYNDVSDITTKLLCIPCYGTDDEYKKLKYTLFYSKKQVPCIHDKNHMNKIATSETCVHYFHNVKDTRTVVHDNNSVESVVLASEPRRKIKYESIDLTDDDDDDDNNVSNSASNSNEPSKKKSCH